MAHALATGPFGVNGWSRRIWAKRKETLEKNFPRSRGDSINHSV